MAKDLKLYTHASQISPGWCCLPLPYDTRDLIFVFTSVIVALFFYSKGTLLGFYNGDNNNRSSSHNET